MAISELINWSWPFITDTETAIKASRQGFWAAILSAIATALMIFLGTFDIARLIHVILFAVLAIGIYKMYRTAAVVVLCVYLLERIIIWYTHGVPDNILRFVIFSVLILMFINAIRGTFAYHRYIEIEGSNAACPLPSGRYLP